MREGVRFTGLMGMVLTSALVAVSSADETYHLAPISILGREQDTSLQPGSVDVVTPADILQIQPRSTEDVLRRVAGIYIKPEEESAVVANIGVRGLPAGDYKTLILEDGVPVQPGIFVGNARYYNPRIQRMDGVEVLKGAASLRYGPNTIGGVINYLSKTPADGVSVSGRVGSWNTREATIEAGASVFDGSSRVGAIATHARSDGFMDKGYEMTDIMVKSGTAIGEDHYLGLKFLYYENEANISYRGLFPEAYAAGAKFNPAPDDTFLTDRLALDLNHEWQIHPDVTLQTLAYWSATTRDYWRYGLVPGQQTTLNADGLRVWNYSDQVQGNNRAFSRVGLDTRLTVAHGAFGVDSESELGVRVMQEDMEDKTVRANRAAPRDPVGAPQRDRVDSADSLAVFAQNRFDFTERFAVTAGLRMEAYEQKRDDRRTAAAADTFSNTEFMPGIGATYQVSPVAQVFGSVYRAFAPPLVGSVVGVDDPPTDAETSVNVELGVRGHADRIRYEITAFQMDFANQVDPGVSGIRNPNEGSALIQGVEGTLGYEVGHGVRVGGNVTYIPTAEYGEDRPGEALKGNRLPDSAEWTGNLSLGYQQGRLQTALLFNYVGATYGNGMNNREFTTETSDTWGGRIPSYYTLDLTGQFAILQDLSVFGAVKNLTDERYVSGLRQGIYVGPERSYELGAKYTF
jgi:Fe(3+) dicitrate transport protein